MIKNSANEATNLVDILISVLIEGQKIRRSETISLRLQRGESS